MARNAAVPTEIRTSRVVLRPWRADDAARLHPILLENWDHLSPWIPQRVADPATESEVAARLASFAADFAADEKWRFGMFSVDGQTVLGEIDLFPRNATGRVAYGESDRAEIGYWLRADKTGHGLVTEAVQTVMSVARSLSRISRLEIRCDARNAPSAAIPKRLGFVLETTIDEPPSMPGAERSALEVWVLPTAIQSPAGTSTIRSP